MSCCCQSVYKMCAKVSACGMGGLEQLLTGWLPDGQYTVKLDFLNSSIEVPVIVEAAVVTTGVVALNENYTYTGKVVDAEGAAVPITVEDDSFDCFEFKTY